MTIRKTRKTPTKKTTRELAGEPQKKKDKIGIRFVEAGKEGIHEWGGFITEAYNAQLFWPTVQPLYSKIHRSMPEIVMSRGFFSSWALNIKPIIELPDKPTDDDKEYKDFLESDFDNMEGGFGKFIGKAVDIVPFMGWGYWSAPPSIRDPNWRPPNYPDGAPDDWRSEADDGLIGLRRLAWRDSSTFAGWIMPNGHLQGWKQQLWPDPVTELLLKDGLHITYMDSNNPEGYSPLESAWRIYTMLYGYQVVHGIGSERGAGYLYVEKTTEGTLSDDDEIMIAETARNLMSGQEGNYGYAPWGLKFSIIDVPFQSAGAILDMIKHLSIETLSLYGMQFIALNTMTSTGAQASQVDSTDTGVFRFNATLDGIADQFDQQIGKRLFEWNKASFPNITKRPTIKFSHIDRTLALNDLANFFRTLDGILPLTDDDYKALRQKSGFLPVNVDTLEAAKEARKLDEAMTPKPPPTQQVQPGQASKQATTEEDEEKQMSEFGEADGKPLNDGGIETINLGADTPSARTTIKDGGKEIVINVNLAMPKKSKSEKIIHRDDNKEMTSIEEFTEYEE